ncbi:MAG: crossover junction endodeoxyribonuclease RuvC [Planctomycetales bacterium]|nr:crossover junction endodeoxyribonuclease RuvC [Planctomycetales bacterium]
MDESLILGIDPGLHITGYGLLRADTRGCRLEEAGVVRGPSRGSLAERICQIHRGICEVLDGCGPAIVALEQLYSHYQRPRTAILMGHARGVICLAAAERSIPVLDYAATHVKKLLTGNGRAPKSQVQDAVQRELGLRSLPEPADVADALAIAMCHYYTRSPLTARHATITSTVSSSTTSTATSKAPPGGPHL